MVHLSFSTIFTLGSWAVGILAFIAVLSLIMGMMRKNSKKRSFSIYSFIGSCLGIFLLIIVGVMLNSQVSQKIYEQYKISTNFQQNKTLLDTSNGLSDPVTIQGESYRMKQLGNNKVTLQILDNKKWTNVQ